MPPTILLQFAELSSPIFLSLSRCSVPCIAWCCVNPTGLQREGRLNDWSALEHIYYVAILAGKHKWPDSPHHKKGPALKRAPGNDGGFFRSDLRLVHSWLKSTATLSPQRGLKLSFFHNCEQKGRQEWLSSGQKVNSTSSTVSAGRVNGVPGLLTDPQN